MIDFISVINTNTEQSSFSVVNNLQGFMVHSFHHHQFKYNILSFCDTLIFRGLSVFFVFLFQENQVIRTKRILN